jgi:hypothetical protein
MMRHSSGRVMQMRAPPRNPRNSPSEQANEAPGVVEREEVEREEAEIERDSPAEDNPSVERIAPDDSEPEPPAFED